MKKLFLVAMIFAFAVMATGCIEGTVKRVGIRYSYADAKCDRIITKGVTHYAACGEKGNLLLGIVTNPGYPVIFGGDPNGPISAIKSDSAGIWIKFMAGTLVNPDPSKCRTFKANTYCEGVVRICGTGTYSPDPKGGYGTFDGDGKFIYMESGASELCGTGKLYDAAMDKDDCYKGIMNILITPGYAYLCEVKDGNVITMSPVQATISLPCIPFWNTIDI